jgi:hypothetical protein
LGEVCPNSLNKPITHAERRAIHTYPTGFLSVKIDGRHSYFEWITAGHYVSGNERGTMTLVTEGLLREVYFGFNLELLFLRLDTNKLAKDDFSTVDELRIRFHEPQDCEIVISGLRESKVSASLFLNGNCSDDGLVQVAVDKILELSVPFEQLGVKPDDPIHLFVEAFADDKSIDRAPREGAIELLTPNKDFDKIMWQV